MIPKLIIYAEDDLEDQLIFYDALEEIKFSHNVKFVGNGEELLNYLHHEGAFEDTRSNPDPELIILDLNMPILDGWETLHRVRNSERFGFIPVVIFSTSKSIHDINKCYKMGANTFICKPHTFSGLKKILTNLIEYWFETGELPNA